MENGKCKMELCPGGRLGRKRKRKYVKIKM
jgi:hypothetical protein